MLTQQTKRKIDSARDILVGKVPDPKAQVEQITTALIYKFMDDMDKESQELGGKARFFTKGYEKYSWTKVLDSKLGGQDRLNLYVEAISLLSQNPHLPQLFREIFKDAFLPYRDPETLTLFLKEVNGFTYDHSEDLGDAFEYLLSVLGSQGDAGQFRTPRHIIDFMVEVVDPKRDETICDPACGTAGFLISAYKHILRKQSFTDKSDGIEKPLTPDQRKQLMNNLSGYDISPDMVRLSKVNMYLHGFPTPTIYEYDTLSSEEKWDESFDVMLANPPFMSPKGGIKPHKRFSVQAKRSEVLFVDYILEHLRPNGRAGIIVPEGIVFQTGNAYKNLRKLLVEDGLFAVVSLPAGVFNPYAGVKTSILFFDKTLEKKTNRILFLKIQNDGYNLGAQRREIEENDLPTALNIIEKYKSSYKDGEDFILSEKERQIAHLVSKEIIAESGEYNLTGDIYKESTIFGSQKWQLAELGDVCEIKKGTSITKASITVGPIPVIAGGQQAAYYHNESNRDGNIITVSASGAYAGFVNYFRTPIFASDCTTIKSKDEGAILTPFVYHYLKWIQESIYKLQKGMGQPHVYGKELSKIKIPLLPIMVQKEIVEKIETQQNLIDACSTIETSWHLNLPISLNTFSRVETGSLVINSMYGTSIRADYQTKGYPVLRIGNVGFCKFDLVDIKKVELEQDVFEKLKLNKGDFLIVRSNGNPDLVGRCAVWDGGFDKENYVYASYLIRFIFDRTKANPKYVMYYFMSSEGRALLNPKQGGGTYNINSEEFKKVPIPFPPLQIQNEIVEKLDLQMKSLEHVGILKKEAQARIDEVLMEVLGDKQFLL